MEERRFSPEQPEEVIELLDIVESSPEENASQAEEKVSGVERVDASDEAEEVLSEEAVGAISTDEQEEVLLKEADAIVEESEEAAPASSDACGLETAENPGDMRREDPEDQGDVAREQRDENEAVFALRERHDAEVRALEERIAALERSCNELAENVESLSQQLAQVGTMFLEDASVRLSMEEMVSHMLDARLPSTVDQEGDSSENNDVSARLESLEKRARDWEDNIEQSAAAAAARVIREEIAAMKANAVNGSL